MIVALGLEATGRNCSEHVLTNITLVFFAGTTLVRMTVTLTDSHPTVVAARKLLASSHNNVVLALNGLPPKRIRSELYVCFLLCK